MYIHIAFFDIFIGMLIDAILLSTFTVHSEESADRHTSFIVLVEEPAGVAFHTQTSEPVPANGLAETPSSPSSGRRRGGVIVARRQVDGGGGLVFEGSDGDGSRGLDRSGVETAFEIEAESVGVLHCFAESLFWGLDLLSRASIEEASSESFELLLIFMNQARIIGLSLIEPVI